MPPPPIKVRGAGRSKGIPSGYIMGRSSSGTGDVELLKLNDLRRMGVAGKQDIAAVRLPFIALTDTPKSYSGEALALVRVNAAMTGLEFVAPTASGVLPLVNGDAPGPGIMEGNTQTISVPLTHAGQDTRLIAYAGVGLDADKPSPPDLTLGATAVYYSTDTTLFFSWDPLAVGWVQLN